MSGVTIEIDLGPLYKTFDQTMDQIVEFAKTDMPNELTAWQAEDMRRRYPNTEVEENACSTEIWPRSRLSIQKAPTGNPRGRPRAGTAPVIKRIMQTKATLPSGPRGMGTKRPILRQELRQKLDERMTNIFNEKVTWKVK
jgi:hypothetical protein